MTERTTDRLAMLGIVAASLVVCWPLLSHLKNAPPPDDDLGLDLLNYYGFAGAGRMTILQYGQFPLRSPWHGGGYPLYAAPDDMTFTPTMPVVLAIGPWAVIKIDFVLTVMAAGLGMFLLTRRKMGYPLVAALFSATAFAFGGFLLTKWLLGWRTVTHAVWLPFIMYALWRGRQRRWWLAVAAGLVAWLLLDHKYVTIVMGWFLLLVGLLRLDGEADEGGPGGGGWFAWGYCGRLGAVWGFGAGLAAVKLIPMWPIVQDHLSKAPPSPWAHQWWPPIVLWLVVAAALAAVPALCRGVRRRRLRAAEAAALGALLLAAIVIAVVVLAPAESSNPEHAPHSVGVVINRTVHFGTWHVNRYNIETPTTSGDRFRCRAPVGPIVALLAVLAVVLRPDKTWKWAIVAGLFLTFELGPLLSRDLAESLGRLPIFSWIRRPREPLNFYYFFLLTLLAGRALDWPTWLRGRRLCRIGAWGLLAGNVLFLGWMAYPRFAYSVQTPLSDTRPPIADDAKGWPPEEGDWPPYHLLDRRGDRWRDRPAFLLRWNIGLARWDLDFRDTRHLALLPSLRASDEGVHKPDPAFTGMASFENRGGEVEQWDFSPNEIVVHVRVDTPDVLVINQIADDDWQPSVGELVPSDGLLQVRLSEPGRHEVRLRYVPHLLYVGLAVSVVVALVGIGVLIVLSRRDARREVAMSPTSVVGS